MGTVVAVPSEHAVRRRRRRLIEVQVGAAVTWREHGSIEVAALDLASAARVVRRASDVIELTTSTTAAGAAGRVRRLLRRRLSAAGRRQRRLPPSAARRLGRAGGAAGGRVADGAIEQLGDARHVLTESPLEFLLVHRQALVGLGLAVVAPQQHRVLLRQLPVKRRTNTTTMKSIAN